MITSEFPPKSGGVGYYVYNLSRTLVNRGHRVTVITRARTSKAGSETVEGISVFRVSSFPLYPFHILLFRHFVNSLFRSLQPKPTLVHVHTPLPVPLKTMIPLITTVHTPMKIDARYHEVFNILSLAEKVQSMTVYPPMESELFEASSKITAVSRSVAKELREYDLDPGRITVIGNGVDEKTFIPARNKDRTSQYVLYTGVLRARKGLFDFIDCAKYVCKEHPDTRFFISGRGPFFHKLQGRIKKRGLEKNVVFLGYVSRSRLVKVYQNATVHVVPSHYEGLPTVLLEAMSCGLPVVATDIGGNNEVISSGLNGFLVPPKSPECMAKIILKLLDDAGLRERLGGAARRTIEENYTWDKIADNIVKCYESVPGQSDSD